jgi:hypothetical protein
MLRASSSRLPLLPVFPAFSVVVIVSYVQLYEVDDQNECKPEIAHMSMHVNHHNLLRSMPLPAVLWAMQKAWVLGRGDSKSSDKG